MKGLIVYQSKTGSAECYAKWIQEDTGFEAFPVEKVPVLRDYDTVIIGSCIRAGSPRIGGWIKSNWQKLKDKNLVFYTTSASLKTDPRLQGYFEKCFPEEIRSRLPYIPLNGKMKFSELKGLDKAMMNFAIKMTAKSNPEEAKKMAQEYNRIDRKDIEPIITLVKNFRK